MPWISLCPLGPQSAAPFAPTLHPLYTVATNRCAASPNGRSEKDELAKVDAVVREAQAEPAQLHIALAALLHLGDVSFSSGAGSGGDGGGGSDGGGGGGGSGDGGGGVGGGAGGDSTPRSSHAVAERDALGRAAACLGVTASELGERLTTRVISVGGDDVTIPLNAAAAFSGMSRGSKGVPMLGLDFGFATPSAALEGLTTTVHHRSDACTTS